MKTYVLSVKAPEAISRALEVLQQGGLVAFPTDTVYGLGALAFDAEAVAAIYRAKERPAEKAIPLLLGEAQAMPRVASEVPPLARRLAAHFWPGALTIAVPKHPALPPIVSSLPTVGLRIPDHDFARKLLRASGPLAVTSANLSGQPSPASAQEVEAQLGGRIALILDGGSTPGGIPSTVVQCDGEELVIVREGPISRQQMLQALAGDGKLSFNS